MSRRSRAQVAGWWSRADAYLRWAHHTDFRDFACDRKGRFGVLVELRTELTSKQAQSMADIGVQISPLYVDARYFSAAVPVRNRAGKLDAIVGLDALRIELASPVAAFRDIVNFTPSGGRPGTTTYIGVIDDGCPFAHAGLRLHGSTTSAVSFLWDQNPEPADLPNDQISPFGYGRIFGPARIDAAVNRSVTRRGSPPDEDAAYDLTGLESLRPLASHGAHALGLFAGSVPLQNRMSGSRSQTGDATDPPSWTADMDLEKTDVGFVQIPKVSLADSTGRWLGRNVLDGLHALFGHASRTTTINRATINISYGPQTGPHDGSSLLERAIDDLRSKQRRFSEFNVVLPAGNSYQARAHGEFDLTAGGGSMTWHVSPDSETPAFLEIWLPEGVGLASAAISVRAPDAVAANARAGGVVRAAADAWHVVADNTAPPGERVRWMVLIALAPTGGFGGTPRPAHGRWEVSVVPIGKQSIGVAHAYLARNDYNFGGLRRGKPGYLWLESYDPEKYLRSREDDPPEDKLPPKARIRRGGSVSGLATGKGTAIAAGFRMSDDGAALYSSGGSSRGQRRGPDWAYPSDESRFVPGLLSWGNRSGAAVRLMGTSAAAPQYAREIHKKGNQALPPALAPEDQDTRIGAGLRPDLPPRRQRLA